MQIIREFKYKPVEVYHFKIGVQLLKLWNFEVPFWVIILKTIWNGKKSNMIKGQNLDPLWKDLF